MWHWGSFGFWEIVGTVKKKLKFEFSRLVVMWLWIRGPGTFAGVTWNKLIFSAAPFRVYELFFVVLATLFLYPKFVSNGFLSCQTLEVRRFVWVNNEKTYCVLVKISLSQFHCNGNIGLVEEGMGKEKKEKFLGFSFYY